MERKTERSVDKDASLWLLTQNTWAYVHENRHKLLLLLLFIIIPLSPSSSTCFVLITVCLPDLHVLFMCYFCMDNKSNTFLSPPAPVPKKKEQTNLRKQFRFQFPAGLCWSSFSVCSSQRSRAGRRRIRPHSPWTKIAHISAMTVQQAGRRKENYSHLRNQLSSSRPFYHRRFLPGKVTG